MTPSEQRVLTRAALLLLLSGAVRWGAEQWRGPPVLPGARNELPRLLAEADAMKADEDRRSRPLEEGETVDPNRATEAELDRLPGVGPATAAAIVAARESSGGFRSPEDLLAVRGIGPATLERIRPRLGLGPGAPVAPGASGRPVLPGARSRWSRGSGGSGASSTTTTTTTNTTTVEVVDVNAADAETLTVVPGIGPALAGRIVEERRRRGGFRRLEELVEVRGIGETMLARMRKHLVIR